MLTGGTVHLPPASSTFEIRAVGYQRPLELSRLRAGPSGATNAGTDYG